MSVEDDYEGDLFFFGDRDRKYPNINHMHMFVENLDEALPACDANGINVCCIGYSDPEATKTKFAALGKTVANKDLEEHITFIILDLLDDLGMRIQLIEPSALSLHNAILSLRNSWNPKTDELFINMNALGR